MIAVVSGIYDSPELYELTCAYRDIRAEVNALRRWFTLRTEPVRTVLELAAGPAEHARELAGQGLCVTALDLNPAMCSWARSQAETAGVSLEVIQADMRTFAAPRRFDAAITMLNSVCHLLTLSDLVAHLRAVAAALAGDGLYIVELAHPADYLTPSPRTSSEWVTETAGRRVSVRWGGSADRIDPVTQVTEEHVTVRVRDPDGSVRTATDVVPNRFWTATEIEAGVRLAGGLDEVARYGSFEDDPLEDPAAWRMIYVLRRT